MIASIGRGEMQMEKRAVRCDCAMLQHTDRTQEPWRMGDMIDE